MEMPIWVMIVIGFIIFSGYMSFRAMRAEAKLEQHYIEREGQVFMERIEKEREKRGTLTPDEQDDHELKSFG